MSEPKPLTLSEFETNRGDVQEGLASKLLDDKCTDGIIRRLYATIDEAALWGNEQKRTRPIAELTKERDAMLPVVKAVLDDAYNGDCLSLVADIFCCNHAPLAKWIEESKP